MKLRYQSSRRPPDIIPEPFRRLAKRPRRGWSLGAVILALAALIAWLWWSQREQPGSGQAHPNPPQASNAVIHTPQQPTSQPTVTPATPQETAPPAAAVPAEFDPEAPTRLQAALARLGFSPGPVDGITGPQTRAALRAFQKAQGIRQNGVPDSATRARLSVDATLYTNYVVTAADTAQLRPLGRTWLAKSRQDQLGYQSILELVAEKNRSDEDLLWQLNPDLNWNRIAVGTTIKVPQITVAEPASRAALVRIYLGERVLQAYDETGKIIAHFPCSIGERVEKRPTGELRVASLAPNPNYTFDPAIFPESPEARELGRKLILQPGPNNPVGTVWIGLDRPGYGIHGTPQPEKVGRTESHGCFRLANWNAEHLLKLVWVGMPVRVEL